MVAKPREGELYSFELPDGRYGVGLVARVETRAKRKPYGIFVYFLAPFRDLSSILRTPRVIEINKSIARLNTSALGIYKGDWKLIGNLESWDRTVWLFPDFYEYDWGTGKNYRLKLSEADLTSPEKRDIISDIKGLEKNCLHGHVSAANHVFNLVEKLPSLDSDLN